MVADIKREDVLAYQRTKHGLATIGCTNLEIQAIFSLISVVLLLGNLTIAPNNSKSEPLKIMEEDWYKTTCDFLGVNEEALRGTLLRRGVTVRKAETMTVPLTLQQASNARDTLAMSLYSKLFDWLVAKINQSFSEGRQKHEESLAIGILDIYGFECFEVNGFEQFCINFCNEHLQHQFNEYVLKLEQQEHMKENITWSRIEFQDNQEVLDVLDKRQAKTGEPLSILTILDEESRIPTANESSFFIKLAAQNYNPRIFRPTNVPRNGFMIAHYAGEVVYDTKQFLDKNKDFIILEMLFLLQSSMNPFVKMIFSDPKLMEERDKSIRKGTNMSTFKFVSVSSQFKESLGNLLSIINKRKHSYIRCIKPNNDHIPRQFDNELVLHQLKCGGVLEAIQVSRQKFHGKIDYEKIVKRYRSLKPQTAPRDLPPKDMVRAILEYHKIPEDRYEFGSAKLFLRAGLTEWLEKLRTNKMNSSATCMQKNYRRLVVRRVFELFKNAATSLETAMRANLARKQLSFLRVQKAATQLQRSIKTLLERRRLIATRKCIKALQSAVRSIAARKEYKSRLQDKRKNEEIKRMDVVRRAEDLKRQDDVKRQEDLKQKALQELHQLRPSRSQRHVAPATAAKVKVHDSCPEHSEQDLRLHCETCNIRICSVCATKSHASHQVANPTKNSVRSMLATLLQKQKEIEEGVEAIKHMKEKISNKVQTIFAELDGTGASFYKTLEIREVALSTTAKQFCSRRLESLKKQSINVGSALETATGGSSLAKQIFKDGADIVLLRMKNPICDRLNQVAKAKWTVEPLENEQFDYYEDATQFFAKIKEIGKIEDETASPALSSASGDGLKPVHTTKNASFKVTVKKRDGTFKKKGGDQLSVVIKGIKDSPQARITDNRDGTYDVSFTGGHGGQYKISVTILGVHVQGSPFSIKMPKSRDYSRYLARTFGGHGSNYGQFHTPFGVAVNSKDFIFATDYRNDRVQVFHPDGAFAYSFGETGDSAGCFEGPKGIAVDAQDNLIVVDRVNNASNTPRYQVFSPDGKLLQEVADTQFKAPSGVAVTSAGHILISDTKTHKVFKFGFDGTVMQSWGSQGNKEGEFQKPEAVAVNSRDEICVADTLNHRIQIFDIDGNFLRTFGTAGRGDGQLKSPSGIAIDVDDNILVSDTENNRIQVFSSEGEFLHKFGTEGENPGEFQFPYGITINYQGYIMVADLRNHRIQIL
eukprot:TRINITY_DN3458_c0_g1_i2.p1 TRINITY_DN3458_c0_g1~~TRINITY_DN3458_c0_g1_i2.p1  ORF type:complete len:1215 (+),score=383.12 TRINITY_DN3458_c0_g1_i2:1716-5360(+)